MNLPKNGGILVIDDRIDEALPIIKMLTKHNIPVMYFSGLVSEMPPAPLVGIRVVFLDLRFAAAMDVRTIVSNAKAILNRLIAERNGPFLLLIWSAHENDYKKEIEEGLSGKHYAPEAILYLSKADYFINVDKSERVRESIINAVSRLSLREEEREQCCTEIVDSMICTGIISEEKILVDDGMDKLEARVKAELKKAGLLHLFILWENAISYSSYATTNAFFYEIPAEVPKEKRLSAMVYYLANHVLEKKMEGSDIKVKIQATLRALNEFFDYFYRDNVIQIDLEDIALPAIAKDPEMSKISAARLNKWKYIGQPKEHKSPGAVYTDLDKQVELHGIIPIGTGGTKEQKDQYIKRKTQIQAREDISYFFIDITGDCAVAQQKDYVHRIVPCVLIPDEIRRDLESKQLIKELKSPPDNIFLIKTIELRDKDQCLLINLDQVHYINTDQLDTMKPSFWLTETCVQKIRQQLSANIGKQGTSTYTA